MLREGLNEKAACVWEELPSQCAGLYLVYLENCRESNVAQWGAAGGMGGGKGDDVGEGSCRALVGYCNVFSFY